MHVKGMCKLSYTIADPDLGSKRRRLSLPGQAADTPGAGDARSGLSAAAKAVAAILSLAADAGEACPTNAGLAAAIGSAHVGAIPPLLNRLQAAGLIEIARGKSGRIVTLLTSGKRTAGEPKAPALRLDRHSSLPRAAAESGRPKARQARREQIDPPPTDREPCFRCGVRGDIGCVHRRRRR